MQHSHFAIGDTFYTRHELSETGWSKWRVTDKGTRTIVAIRVDVVQRTKMNALGFRVTRWLNETEATEQGFFNGPPYAVVERVFDEHDMAVCHREPNDDL